LSRAPAKTDAGRQRAPEPAARRRSGPARRPGPRGAPAKDHRPARGRSRGRREPAPPARAPRRPAPARAPSTQTRVARAQTVEPARAPEAPLVEQIPEDDGEDPQTIDGGGGERRRGGLGEVARGHGDLGDAESRRDHLRDDLLVEDETVAIGSEVDRFENVAVEGAIAGVVLG